MSSGLTCSTPRVGPKTSNHHNRSLIRAAHARPVALSVQPHFPGATKTTSERTVGNRPKSCRPPLLFTNEDSSRVRRSERPRIMRPPATTDLISGTHGGDPQSRGYHGASHPRRGDEAAPESAAYHHNKGPGMIVLWLRRRSADRFPQWPPSTRTDPSGSAWEGASVCRPGTDSERNAFLGQMREYGAPHAGLRKRDSFGSVKSVGP